MEVMELIASIEPIVDAFKDHADRNVVKDFAKKNLTVVKTSAALKDPASLSVKIDLANTVLTAVKIPSV